MTRPYYSQISAASGNKQKKKYIAVKTATSITEVTLEGNTCADYQKVGITDRLSRESISAFTYLPLNLSKTGSPVLVIGYRSGLISVHSESKCINLLNLDEKAEGIFLKQPVIHLLPAADKDQVLAIFNDSSMLRFNYNGDGSNALFLENLRIFSSKMSFNNQQNKITFRRKIVGDMVLGYHYCEDNHELSSFHATNKSSSAPNPVSYHKFNCRTIADAVVISHSRLKKKFLKQASGANDTIFAYVNFDGCLCIYDYDTMEPQFSIKSYFGGYSSLTFSPNCEYLALAGHDDCLTVVKLENLSVIRCVGHRSFVSKAVFQTIPFKEDCETAQDVADVFESNQVMRIVTGSMDGQLSVFEINKTDFSDHSHRPISNKGIMHLDLSKEFEPLEVKPLSSFRCDDGIGWIELVGNLLIVSCMDGVITIIEIISSKSEAEEEPAKLSSAEQQSNSALVSRDDSGGQNRSISNGGISTLSAKEQMERQNVEGTLAKENKPTGELANGRSLDGGND